MRREAELDEQALVRTLKLLRALIEEEHALEVDRAAAIRPLPFEAALPVTDDTRRTYRFRLSGQLSTADAPAAALKIGDGVDVLQPDGRETTLFGVISARTPTMVQVDFGRPLRPGDLPPQGSLRPRVDANQRTVRLQAIERVVRQRHTRRWLGALLADAEPLPPAEPGWQPPTDLGLTAGQRAALAGASRSRDLFLIQGPPGTGKTTVIAALVRYFTAQRGARVLLSSAGHRAIDNALERLAAGDLHVLRLGQAAKVTGAGQEVRFADLLAQAEQDVPRRHLAARTQLEAWSQGLGSLEPLLAELDALQQRIHACDRICAQHLAGRAARLRARRAIRHPGQPLPRQRMAPPAPLGWQPLTHVLQPVQRLLHRLHGSVAPAAPPDAPASSASDTASSAALDAPTSSAPDATSSDPADAHRPPRAGRAGLHPLPETLAGLRAQRQQLVTRIEATLPHVSAAVCGLHLPPLSVATADQTRAALAAVRRARAQAHAALGALSAWSTLIEQPGRVADVLVETADVVAATAVGINSGRDGARLAELDFDVAIIDEAGQAQLTDLIVPLSRARTVILVGDHQQLPPYVDHDLLRRCADKGIDTAWLESSVFERLWPRVPPSHRARLDTQFRMPEAIASFLGRVFYDGELASASPHQAAAPVCDLFRSPVVLVDTSGTADRGETAVAPGFTNQAEARLIAAIAAKLPPPYRTAEGLGIIAPYSAQVSALRQAVAQALGPAASDAWLVDAIATVDSFQGQERDVVLVSLTRSNADGAVGFLSDLKRLNVTLSRARRQLVVIGDLSTHCAPGGAPERQAFARFARELAAHVQQHGELLPVAELHRRLAAPEDRAAPEDHTPYLGTDCLMLVDGPPRA